MTTSTAAEDQASSWVRPGPTTRDRYIDLATAIALYLGAVLTQQLYRVSGVYEHPADGALTFGLLAVTILPLAARRSHPVPSAIVAAAGFIAAGTLQVPELLITQIALFLAIYSVGAWVSRRSVAVAARAVIVIAMALWLMISLFQSATDPDVLDNFPHAGALSPLVAFLLIQVLINLLYFAAAWWFGDRAFAAARQRHELEQRTVELERERERTAAQAVALDRVRIARELHDAVAHHVSVIGIQAGAARTVLTSDPDAASDALPDHRVDEPRDDPRTARHARHPARPRRGARHGARPRPAARARRRLARRPGVPTSLQVIGDPVPVPAIASVNLYRIAQEALTNVRKHAGPDATADIRVRYGHEHVELEVANTGGVTSRRLPGGLGQLGMRERVAVVRRHPRARPAQPRRLPRARAHPAAGGRRMTRVLLVDDQELVRAGFRMILDAEPGIEVVGEAGDGHAAVALAPRARARRDLHGRADAGHRRPRGHPPDRGGDPTAPAVLVLTTFDRDDYLFEALEAGASGFLLKTASPEQLVEAVRVLARGDALLSPAVTRRVIERFGGAAAPPASTTPPSRSSPNARRRCSGCSPRALQRRDRRRAATSARRP